MLFADILLSTEAVLAMAALLAALTTAVVFLFRQFKLSQEALLAQVVAQKDLALTDMTSQKKSYQEMLAEVLTAYEGKNKKQVAKAGLPVVTPLVAVVPEHSSPTTLKQRDAAELQTTRARVTALMLAIDQPPRQTSELAVEGEVSPGG